MSNDRKFLTVLSWNVNGFNRKRSEVLHQLSVLKADVVFLQETHVGPDRIYSTGCIKIESLDGDYAMQAFTVFKGSARGVAVLFKKNLECGGFKIDGDSKGRYLIISCQICGDEFVFVNIYNSNDEKIKFTDFTYLSTQIPPSAYLVIGGDFNTVMDSDLDRTSNLRNLNHRKSFAALQTFLDTFSLVDVWRCVYPEVKSFTFFDGKGQSRLDYFFIQSHHLERVNACNIHERPKYLDKEYYISDHTPLSIQIQTDGPKWQLDACLLRDKSCMERLSLIIKTISKIKTKTRKSLWPGVKIRLLCEAIAFQQEASRCSEMQTFEPQVIEHMEHMEQEDSESYTETVHSANASCTHQSLQNFLDHLHQTERFEDLKLALNTVLTDTISRKEILLAILSIPECEYLTTGGLTLHFYKHYASKITHLLQAFFNQILTFTSQREPLELLNPSGNDHSYSRVIHQHYRPITVTDMDYKILASVLAERLKSVIEHVLNTGLSKHIDDTISSIPIESADTKTMLVVSIGVDARALKLSYLSYSLKFVNLPDRFTSVLMLLLIEGNANMDSASQGLKVECPLTPLLKRICLLPLIHSIDSEKRLLESKCIPMSVIDKDEAVIFIPNTEAALEGFEKMLLEFTETSGLVVEKKVLLERPCTFGLEKD